MRTENSILQPPSALGIDAAARLHPRARQNPPKRAKPCHSNRKMKNEPKCHSVSHLARRRETNPLLPPHNPHTPHPPPILRPFAIPPNLFHIRCKRGAPLGPLNSNPRRR